MFARYDTPRDLYTVEWNGAPSDAIEDKILLVVAHALKSAFQDVTISWSKDGSILTLMAYGADGSVMAHLDMRAQKEMAA